MALIENTVGTLPYLLTDFDQHSYEAEDCFTRFMPKEKLHTAVRPIVAPSRPQGAAGQRPHRHRARERPRPGVRAWLAGGDAQATVVRRCGRRRTVLRADASGVPRQGRTAHSAQRAADRKVDHVSRRLGACWPRRIWTASIRSTTTSSPSTSGSTRTGVSPTRTPIYAPAMLSMRDLDRSVRRVGPGARRRRPVHPAARRARLRPLPRRSVLRPVLGPHQRGETPLSATTSPSSTIKTTSRRTGAGSCVPPFQFSAWQWQNTYGERPITDTLSALIFDNLFGRFPNIKVLVSEFGAEWVPHFIRHMDKSRGMARNGPWLGGQLTERPSTIFKKHVRVVPYPEDDTVALIEQARHHRDAADGLGLAARRGAARTRRLLSARSTARRDDPPGLPARERHEALSRPKT